MTNLDGLSYEQLRVIAIALSDLISRLGRETGAGMTASRLSDEINTEMNKRRDTMRNNGSMA